MILNSFSFLTLLPVIIAIYTLVIALCKNSRYNNILSSALLTSISYAFFFAYQPEGAIILFAITIITFVLALGLDKISHETGGNVRVNMRRWLIVGGVVIVIIPLIVMKYSSLILTILHIIECRIGVTIVNESPDLSTRFIVPLGISYFTFQSLGYVWDVYRNKICAERNFIYYMLFVGFFPQISSGPISKAEELLFQIKDKRVLTTEDFTEGVRLMLWGYFLKTVVADRLATFVDPVFADYTNFSGVTCLWASIFYTLQIYGDFAGYSLIAIGVGRLFGFKLINNFNRPYFSDSITEFWKRWHISLTRWLREYIYIPLGGNRKGKARTYCNILTTFIISGIWHGANFTFIVWGFIHGIIQCVEKWFNIKKSPNKLITVLRILFTFFIVNFAFIFFRMPTVRGALAVCAKIFSLSPGASLTLSNTQIVLIVFAVVTLFITEFIQEYFKDIRLLRHRNIVVRCATITTLFIIILTMGVLDSGQFIYAKF